MPKHNGIKILDLDIESAPSQGYFWDIWKQNIPIKHVAKPGYTLCFAASWRHTAKNDIVFSSVQEDGMIGMLEKMWLLLDEADAVVHYNGKKYDIPVLYREFVKHDYLPPSPFEQIDLYSIVRRNFKFLSNKLDFVCKELGIGAKEQHKGMDLWFECMAGDKKAWKQMKKYNIQDIKLLEPLYDKLLPWIPNHPNVALWMTPGKEPKCPNCGSTHLHTKSYKRTRVLSYTQYHCQECGFYPRARTHTGEKREDILR